MQGSRQVTATLWNQPSPGHSTPFDTASKSATTDGEMTTALDHYRVRMQGVLDHIDQHLDDDLDLDTVSSVAAFSKCHFHRQFKATFGLSLLSSEPRI